MDIALSPPPKKNIATSIMEDDRLLPGTQMTQDCGVGWGWAGGGGTGYSDLHDIYLLKIKSVLIEYMLS